MIFYLVYLSSASYLYTEADLSDILSKSRQNNTSKDVTGLLLYHEGSILQVLEGNEEVVMKLYKKIEKDDRHFQILKMVEGVSDERCFPDWSMGFKTVTSDEWNELKGYLSLNPAKILSRLKENNRRINTVVKSFMTVSLR